jgi:hypothetical protein
VADIDTALAAHPPLPETARSVTVTDRKCKRHDWGILHVGDSPVCNRCFAIRDLTKSVRGKSARRRGNDYERELAARLGGTKVGHLGLPEDVRAGMFVVQSKVRGNFPSWMTDELAKLPRTDGRIPLLVVADVPGPGHRRRAIVVLSLDDWCDLHGDGDLEP